jgi:signal-transduction protein with cAMP-binding, CBS, and nucleotidyltransferase domain
MVTVREVLETKGREVLSTQPGATILQAVQEMCRKHVGALLVLDRAVPVGIISERDVMTRVVLAQHDPATTHVRDVMTSDVVCIDADSSIEQAMAVMTERHCRHLPAVHGGSVSGMVSIGDLVRRASQDQEFETRMLHEYVAGRYPG